jgi:hypothetical protein
MRLNQLLEEQAAEQLREHSRRQEEPEGPAIQRDPSSDRPPPSTMPCPWG